MSLGRTLFAQYRSQGIVCGRILELSGSCSHKHHPLRLRRIRCRGPETGKTSILLPGLFLFSPWPSVSRTWPDGWLNFSGGTRLLRSKAFHGNPESAVKARMWTAVSVQVLVAIIRKENDSIRLHLSTPCCRCFRSPFSRNSLQTRAYSGPITLQWGTRRLTN